jgi:hypothetical protein
MRLIRSMTMPTKERRGVAVFSTPVGWSIYINRQGTRSPMVLFRLSRGNRRHLARLSVPDPSIKIDLGKATSLSSPWPTSSPVSPGLYCPAATITGPSHPNGAEKTPAAWKRCALPLSRTTTTTKVFPTEVCTGAARTKEQSQRRVRSLVPRMVFNDRPT